MRVIKQYEDGANHYHDGEHGFIVQLNGRVSWSDSWGWVTDSNNPLFTHKHYPELHGHADYYLREEHR